MPLDQKLEQLGQQLKEGFDGIIHAINRAGSDD